jgi:hypothetical protein
MLAMRNFGITSVAAVFTVTAPLLTTAGATPGGDTIAVIAGAARRGVDNIGSVQLGLNDAVTVMRRVTSDAEVQKALLTYSQKQDAAGATAYLQRLAPNTTVAVKEIADFRIVLDFLAKGHVVLLCASDEGKCSGHNASITID